MQIIGRGQNIITLILYLLIFLGISTFIWALDYKIGLILFVVLLPALYFNFKTRTVYISANSIVVKDLFWRQKEYNLSEVESIGHTFSSYYFIELKNSKLIHFTIPFSKYFSYAIHFIIKPKHATYQDEVLDLINKQKALAVSS